jgi:hypothetical protein
VKTEASPRIFSPEDSAFWRQAYLDAFIDTAKEYYQRNIASPHQFSDGVHYTGYLWDCLRSYERITIQRFRLEVVRHPEVYVLADNHSRDRIPGAPLWPYPAYSVAGFESTALLESLDSLPEDIYVFDSSLSWTLVKTHEYDGKRRFCWAVVLKNKCTSASTHRCTCFGQFLQLRFRPSAFYRFYRQIPAFHQGFAFTGHKQCRRGIKQNRLALGPTFCAG